MSKPSSRADELKKQGNELFNAGDYQGADKYYSLAIVQDSTLASLYTNRSMARMRLEKYEDVILDCERALGLKPTTPTIEMKAHFYLGQALNILTRPNEALRHCLRAYQLAVETHSASAAPIALQVLEAKKKRWEGNERRRIDAEAGLMNDLKQIIRSDVERKVAELRLQADMMSGLPSWDFATESESVRQEGHERCTALETVFARADTRDKYQVREVPDYLIDNISFQIMMDPVTTTHGQSYDRSTILDHLRRSKTDPLTRERLTEADLRPNLALKAACTEFLDKNGWAVDY